MEVLRLERNTKGFSEGFRNRRRFPIVKPEVDDLPEDNYEHLTPRSSFINKPSHARSAEDIWKAGVPSPQG